LQIRNDSRQALNDANEAIFGATTTSQQIGSLLEMIHELEQRLKNTQKLAQEQSIETSKTYDDAAIILSSVESIRLPNILPGAFHSDSANVRTEGQNALKSAMEQGNEQADLLAEAAKMLKEASEQLDAAKEKQSAIDGIFSEVGSYNTRTQAAFDLATKTWNDAKDSHDALSGKQKLK
jgi:hypothetical protein